LDQKPAEAGQTTAAVEHDCGSTFARTEDVERSPSDIHGSANLWKASAVSTIADDLIHRARKEKAAQRKRDSLHSSTLRQRDEVTINVSNSWLFHRASAAM
jgi:hypothetical protein